MLCTSLGTYSKLFGNNAKILIKSRSVVHRIYLISKRSQTSEMAINDELIYEVNEQGERVVVKSTESNRRAFLRFSNRTKRPVDIWWRDFQGYRRHYVRLKPNASYDVNSFITHPWEFTDAATSEHYGINNKQIFRAPANIGGMMYRTNWNITIGVRTLRDTALLVIAERIPFPDLAMDLELPLGLLEELQDLIQKIMNSESEPMAPVQ